MKLKQALGAGALGVAGIAVGAAIAFSGAANAATGDASSDSTQGSTSISSAATSATTPTTPPAAPTNSTPPQRSDETVITGAKADTLTAAAKAKVAGATVIRVETDADGAAYEVHMKKADGSLVTVLFNSDLSVKSVEQGMGGAPKGAPAGAPAGAPTNAPAPSASTTN